MYPNPHPSADHAHANDMHTHPIIFWPTYGRPVLHSREARQPHVGEPAMSEVELATRRQLRNSAQDEDEMPSLEELGLSLPGETYTFLL